MRETVHIWTENPIYCHKLAKVLNADAAHLNTECSTCKYFAGSAQGQGVENKYYDGSNEPLVQNPNPDVLMQRMRGIKPEIVENMIEARASVGKQNRLAALLSTTVHKYKVTKNGQHVALLTFAPDIAINVNSDDQVFLSNISLMIVNPVNGVAVGAPEYADAVIKRLQNFGYDIKSLN